MSEGKFSQEILKYIDSPTESERKTILKKLVKYRKDDHDLFKKVLLSHVNDITKETEKLSKRFGIFPKTLPDKQISRLSDIRGLNEKITGEEKRITEERAAQEAAERAAAERAAQEAAERAAQEAAERAAQEAAERAAAERAAQEAAERAAAERAAQEAAEREKRKLMFGITKKGLETFLSDRAIAKQTDFTRSGDKSTGMSTGYVAKRKSDQKSHILKRAKKETIGRGPAAQDKIDLATEYISSRFYERILLKRAPKINLVKGEKTDSSALYLSSKFFDNFKTLTELTGRSINGDINPYHNTLSRLQGFEKVIAACNIGGELDYHASNLGVVPAENPDGSSGAIYDVVKIDHGRSTLSYSSESELREDIHYRFNRYNYLKMKFNVTEYRIALEEHSKISDDEIEKFVSKSAHDLTKLGFDFRGLEYIDNKVVLDSSHKSQATAVAKYYIEIFKKRREIVKDLVRTLKIIEKIDGVDKNWKNGTWLTEINSQDPIIWAKKNQKTIEGVDPICWAYQNGVTASPGSILNEKITKFENAWTVKNRKEVIKFVKSKFPKLEKWSEIKQSFKTHKIEFFKEKRAKLQQESDKVKKLPKDKLFEAFIFRVHHVITESQAQNSSSEIQKDPVLQALNARINEEFYPSSPKNFVDVLKASIEEKTLSMKAKELILDIRDVIVNLIGVKTNRQDLKQKTSEFAKIFIQQTTQYSHKSDISPILKKIDKKFKVTKGR